MGTAPLAAPPEPPGGVLQRIRTRGTWPLSLYVLGFPLWWALGLLAVVPLVSAFAMTLQLLRRRRVYLPPASSWWLLFLVWASFGVVLTFADAPLGRPVSGASALLPYAVRFSWYLVATVFLLWVVNRGREALSDRYVHLLLGYLFLVTIVGGTAGVVFPTFEFTSAVEAALPGALRFNDYVQTLVHPALADVQTVLGRAEARPIAPFAFSNSWGSAVALLLPFLVAFCVRTRSWWVRGAGLAVVLLGLVPIVYSLNRGLWICVGFAVVGVVALLLSKGRPGLSAAVVGAVVAAAVLFTVTPLLGIFQDRLEHAHSNERRAQLAEATVQSTTVGSPVVGFGTVREVAGNFSSIAGGRTASCDACGVPPLGTQGQLWVVLFQQGYVGAVLFFGFFAAALARCWRCRTPNETVAAFVLAFFFIQSFVYDLVGVSLAVVMLAIGLVAREQREDGVDPLGVLRTAGRLGRDLRRAVVPVAVLAAVGGLAGVGWVLTRPDSFVSRVDMLLTPSAVSAVSPGTDTERLPAESTLDTEAALLFSQSALSRVAGDDLTAVDDLRQRVRVSAEPNTTVLSLSVTAGDRADAADLAGEVASAYLVTRRGDLELRRDRVIDALREQLRALDRRVPGGNADAATLETARDRIKADISRVTLSPVEAGSVIRQHRTRLEPRQFEVPVMTGVGLGILAGLAAAAVGQVTRRRRS